MNNRIIPRRKPLTANIGIFGVGYWKYWEQFDGLYEELVAKQELFVEKVSQFDVNLKDFGMVEETCILVTIKDIYDQKIKRYVGFANKKPLII